MHVKLWILRTTDLCNKKPLTAMYPCSTVYTAWDLTRCVKNIAVVSRP